MNHVIESEYHLHCQVDFSTAGRELTPTMKMARHAILKKYSEEVRSNLFIFCVMLMLISVFPIRIPSLPPPVSRKLLSCVFIFPGGGNVQWRVPH